MMSLPATSVTLPSAANPVGRLESIQQPPEGKGERGALDISAIKMASLDEKYRLIRAFLSSYPEHEYDALLNKDSSSAGKALSQMLNNALDSLANPDERATLLRVFVSMLPSHLSHLVLPDGTKAVITGHLVDRLMTRFNIQSPIRCVRILHRSAAKLHIVQLPALIQVIKQIHHLKNATHWRFQNEWTLIEANGVIVTVYYRTKDKSSTKHH